MIELFDHQEEGFQYLTKRHGGYLFWKPRVGKTLPALFAAFTSKTLPMLIITKPSIMETFRKALVKDMHLKNSAVGVLQTNWPKEKRIKVAESHNVVICNYQAAVPLRIMTRQPWRAVIFDESLALGYIESKVTRYIVRSIPKQDPTQMRIALTGTPASESPRQYASQFFAVDGHYMGYNSIHDYMAEEWKTVRKNRNKLVPVRIEHLEEIKKYIHDNASFLSLEDLGLGSEILYDQRFVHINEKQLDALDWAVGRKETLNKMSTVVGDSPGGLGDMVYATFENMINSGIDPRTREIINYAKINDVFECYIDDPRPILILSGYVDIIPEVYKRFHEAGAKVAYIDGTVIKSEAEEIRQRFQDGELDIVVGQSQVLAEGLDFSRANTTYYLNNLFSLNIREQTSQRTINLNKTEPVEIIDICTDETMEYKMVKKLNKKEQISESFLRKNSRIR